MAQSGNDFNAVRISLASPDQIRTWSYGEVTKPETINYRTLRPEKDGLFCERIFGPTKDWECYCGKYKKIRYKGVICDRCGVEVARSKVRRERMGRITLAAPVAHIWFSKGTPSRLGLLLDLSPRNLEKVVYFAQYLVTRVDDELRQASVQRLQAEMDRLDEEATAKSKELQAELDRLDEETKAKLEELQSELSRLEETAMAKIQAAELPSAEAEEAAEEPTGKPSREIEAIVAEINEQLKKDKEDIEATVSKINEQFKKDKKEAESGRTPQIEGLNEDRDEIDAQVADLEELRVGLLLTEGRYRQVRELGGEMFRAGMGAEAVLDVLTELDLDRKRNDLQEEIRSTSGQRRKKAIKTLRVVEAFRTSGNKPEWMVLTVLPVLPPELRPMVQLDGGRFATSDLNDLYRRVINRNNRLKRLIELQAPEIIVRNEKRMLQEAVDALIDNGRRGRAVSGSHNHKLKSLSDLLRGKQGRFRQNLLGKRVDYSGRSVITVGPNLKLYECGLPRRMALELFKPFVMNRLALEGHAHNIKSAKRMAERARPEVWDILEDVVKERPVLLNRAPTLHRLGIQAFKPRLVDGGAIQVHPLVCTAFNADFDGDQMAVHVPLSRGAVQEANKIMLSTYNMLSPSSGEPIVAPTQDMILGCYYMTMVKEDAPGTGRRFSSFEDARLEYELGNIHPRALIKVRHTKPDGDSEWIDTTVGRIIFNEVLPPELGFRNADLDKSALKEITAECFRMLGNEKTMEALDAIKDLGFRYASKSGITIAINDIEVSSEKEVIIGDAERDVATLEQQYMDGLITEEEKYRNAVQIWTGASDDLSDVIEENLRNYGGIYLMATSGAKGNIAQIKQMAGMRGLMSDPKGRIIDRPIKSNFREGLSVLEYFISTHGARKGQADTALRTADSGYLTRRLIDVAQEVTIATDDCGTEAGLWIQNDPDAPLVTPFEERVASRLAASPAAHPETGEILVDRNEAMTDTNGKALRDAGVDGILVRSPMTCEAQRGMCRNCYGNSLATWAPVMMGEAVGIIAAQSIGEPGTQLTMRTFHTGGIAGIDITSGLPRVEELFEARSPKGEAVLSEIDGVVEVKEAPDGRTIEVVSSETYADEYPVPEGFNVLIADGDEVVIGAHLAAPEEPDGGEEDETSIRPAEVAARVSGIVQVGDGTISVAWTDEERREYVIPAAAHITVKSGDQVAAGEALTAGPKSPQQILRIQGREAVQKYLIDEVQMVYRSQGVAIHNKHIEVIVSQMLGQVRIDAPGDTDQLPGEFVDHHKYEEINSGILAEGGEPATASPVLLGITRASLNVESFLAAASFQETTRVLTESAINGKTDYLRGLKENVIIGRLIPARFDMSDEGRERLGLEEAETLEPVGALSDAIDRPPLFQSDDGLEGLPAL